MRHMSRLLCGFVRAGMSAFVTSAWSLDHKIPDSSWFGVLFPSLTVSAIWHVYCAAFVRAVRAVIPIWHVCFCNICTVLG